MVILFLKALPMAVYFLNSAWFCRNLSVPSACSWVVLWLVDNCLSCVTAQTRNLYVTCILRLSYSAPSGYIYCDDWHKSMSHFASMCCSYPLNNKGLFYDSHESHFDDRAFYILCTHNIQCFILRAGDYVHDQPNDNGPNMNIKNLYGNARMNWMRHHRTLKSTPPHTNYVLVET